MFRRFFLFLLTLIVLVSLAGALFLGPALPVVMRWAALPTPFAQPFNILVAGRDVEYCKPGFGPIGLEAVPCPGNENRRTDTMIVLSLNPHDKAIKVLSIPRDTYVGEGYTSENKINAVLPTKGPNAMTNAVEQLLGIKLAGYLIVSLKGTRDLVDALGGVKIFVPAAMQYQDRAAGLNINLKAGEQTLDGKTIEGYLRFRHDALGDIGRVQRQQAFFRAISDKLRQPATWSRLPKILQAINNNIETNLDRSSVGHALAFLPQKPRFDTLLLPGDFWNAYGVSYWRANEEAVNLLIEKHFVGSDKPARNSKRLSVAVMNITKLNGLARATQNKLQNKGYRNVWITEPKGSNPGKTIVISNSSLEEAEQIVRDLGVGQAVVSGEGNLYADITVQVGEDAARAKP